jgi:hypothetical protein
MIDPLHDVGDAVLIRLLETFGNFMVRMLFGCLDGTLVGCFFDAPFGSRRQGREGRFVGPFSCGCGCRTGFEAFRSEMGIRLTHDKVKADMFVSCYMARWFRKGF